MLAGLMNALPHQYFTGISVMKNNREMEDAVRSLLLKRERPFQLIHDYHFGGYAKHNPVLIDFMNGFYQQTGIPSDFVYTGKLFFAITDLIRKDYFPEESGLLLVHSGGLQGNLSLPKEKLYY
jgi:1-aminocyclopropane-1-carboxylate deaminase